MTAEKRSGPPVDPADQAREICLRLLTGAPQTRAKLASALRKRDIPEEVADIVLDRLEEVGLVDDASFATAWVESRHAGRGLGRRALAHELRQRGVDDATVAGAVSAVSTEDEYTAARRLVDRRLPSMDRLDPQARVRRLAGMLARKGYSGGLAGQVIREAIRDRAEAEEAGGPAATDAMLDGLGEG